MSLRVQKKVDFIGRFSILSKHLDGVNVFTLSHVARVSQLNGFSPTGRKDKQKTKKNRLWLARERADELQLMKLAQNRRQCGWILDRVPTMWCSISLLNWKWLSTAAQVPCTEASWSTLLKLTASIGLHFIFCPPKNCEAGIEHMQY